MRYNVIKNADLIVKNSKYVIKNPYANKNNWNKTFGNSKPICLELGTGRGNFIIEMAKKYPNLNFIGVELYDSQMVSAVEKLNNLNTTPLKDGISIYNLLKRPEITIQNLRNNNLLDLEYPTEIEEEVEINIKYDWYIKKSIKDAEKMLNLENKKIPDDINYDLIKNIASEARQKLNEVRPTSIGQAIRISGVNPADISILMVYLKKEYKNELK